jgi:anthranilate/para-aminobenzoate synthase component I
VWSRIAEIVATRDVGVTPSSVLEAVLPCGSVTGAPKVRAMEIIAELEAHRRGLYTGAFGYVGRDGGVCLAMAIRTAVLRDGTVEYFAGGGIVAESDPDREVEETRWKASQLSRVGA